MCLCCVSHAPQVKEMGISGTGSLEPGAASGSEFVIRYNDKFLQFYYAANPIELSGMPD